LKAIELGRKAKFKSNVWLLTCSGKAVQIEDISLEAFVLYLVQSTDQKAVD
jgi:hypothetical protein